MSGGAIDDDYRLYLLDDWANALNGENPLLAKQMHDLGRLLYVYDDYLAGDCGTEEVEKAWKDYSDKWLSGTSPLESIVQEIADGLKDSIIKGWNPVGKDRYRDPGRAIRGIPIYPRDTMTWTDDDQRRWELHRRWELAEQAEDRLVRSFRFQRHGLILLGGIIAALVVANLFLI